MWPIWWTWLKAQLATLRKWAGDWEELREEAARYRHRNQDTSDDDYRMKRGAP